MEVKRKVRHMCVMAREDQHFRLRLPSDLKDRVEAAARKSGRSINGEVVHLLNMALAGGEDEKTWRLLLIATKTEALMAWQRLHLVERALSGVLADERLQEKDKEMVDQAFSDVKRETSRLISDIEALAKEHAIQRDRQADLTPDHNQ